MKLTHYSLILALALLWLGCSNNTTNKSSFTMETVKDVDIQRYLGTWYEIARFPHSFEKGLVGVTATYELKPNGNISVLNQGYKGTLTGKHSKAKAFAKIPVPTNTGRLKVYFFWPFGAEYLVLDLDKENYSYALIGSSSPNYLWILSRTPQMDEATYQMLVDKAKGLGYDISKLELVPQKAE